MFILDDEGIGKKRSSGRLGESVDASGKVVKVLLPSAEEESPELNEVEDDEVVVVVDDDDDDAEVVSWSLLLMGPLSPPRMSMGSPSAKVSPSSAGARGGGVAAANDDIADTDNDIREG